MSIEVFCLKDGGCHMNLTTERCLIRPFIEDDWQDVYAYTSDLAVMKYIPKGVFLEKRRRNLSK